MKKTTSSANVQSAETISTHFASPLKDFTSMLSSCFVPLASHLLDLSQVNDSRRNWQSKNYPWSAHIYDILQNTFGYHQWRENQQEIINATMSERDVFVTMPTGGGKSLYALLLFSIVLFLLFLMHISFSISLVSLCRCYQIPAACTDGITIVISPLISLIEDQVMIAKSLDLHVNYMSGKQQKEEFMEVWRGI
jgi:superfamily II DNA helicase RecQ